MLRIQWFGNCPILMLSLSIAYALNTIVLCKACVRKALCILHVESRNACQASKRASESKRPSASKRKQVSKMLTCISIFHTLSLRPREFLSLNPSKS